jgi:hypothetical protein
LCQLQDRETQKRIARDLQKPAPQAATGVMSLNDLVI